MPLKLTRVTGRASVWANITAMIAACTKAAPEDKVIVKLAYESSYNAQGQLVPRLDFLDRDHAERVLDLMDTADVETVDIALIRNGARKMFTASLRSMTGRWIVDQPEHIPA